MSWRREQLIGGGPWVVVYTRGPLLWQQATAPGKILNFGNQVHSSIPVNAATALEVLQSFLPTLSFFCHMLPVVGSPAAHHFSLQNTALQASQEFDPAERTVINRAQLAGDRLFVTASGTYEPLVGRRKPRVAISAGHQQQGRRKPVSRCGRCWTRDWCHWVARICGCLPVPSVPDSCIPGRLMVRVAIAGSLSPRPRHSICVIEPWICVGNSYLLEQGWPSAARKLRRLSAAAPARPFIFEKYGGPAL